MERHEILDLMATLKLAGMRSAYDEIVEAATRAQHPVPRVVGELLLAQVAAMRARSIAYQMGMARFPLAKTLAEFDFAASPVNEPLVRDLHQGGFLATQRNAVLIGGTGTGKSHLAIAIAANAVRNGARVRFFKHRRSRQPARSRGPRWQGWPACRPAGPDRPRRAR